MKVTEIFEQNDMVIKKCINGRRLWNRQDQKPRRPREEKPQPLVGPCEKPQKENKVRKKRDVKDRKFDLGHVRVIILRKEYLLENSPAVGTLLALHAQTTGIRVRVTHRHNH